ncbi:hypothetical protein NIES4074_47550 [Cylindrospermum sp. NIES-4074]|nr:hypothetical protein NIES4074_47550 [Cylindrospermum sp. NIES-4074]
MNNKITVALAIIAALASLESSVSAQLPKPTPENVTLSGDSLVGIDNRSAQQDFGKFFDQQNSGRSSSNNTGNTSEQQPYNESISLPDTPIFLQPAQSGNGNDGLQVQLDLGDE